jgi:hypothetical protein
MKLSGTVIVPKGLTLFINQNQLHWIDNDSHLRIDGTWYTRTNVTIDQPSHIGCDPVDGGIINMVGDDAYLNIDPMASIIAKGRCIIRLETPVDMYTRTSLPLVTLMSPASHLSLLFLPHQESCQLCSVMHIHVYH